MSRLLLVVLVMTGCRLFEKGATKVLEAQAGEVPTPLFDSVDAHLPRIDVALEPVATGLPLITDIVFPPGRNDVFVGVTKAGDAYIVNVATGESTLWFYSAVRTDSEQGLLSLAFAPDYAESGRFYTYSTPIDTPRALTRVERWQGDLDAPPTSLGPVLDIAQPYANHNGGQLAFGPDGMLYLGVGDGGAANDPHNNGQDATTLLGSIVRIDVSGNEGYAVPPDNPWVERAPARGEVWAIGLRNPWRMAFAPDGRLVVADVGQDQWEEVTIVAKGENHGWNVREAEHCFPPGSACTGVGMSDPIWSYNRQAGRSITGGYVAKGDAVPALAGKYVFGDFATGRMWALDLPTGRTRATASALGKWPLLISTFGQDADGRLYVGQYDTGAVYRFAASSGLFLGTRDRP